PVGRRQRRQVALPGNVRRVARGGGRARAGQDGRRRGCHHAYEPGTHEPPAGRIPRRSRLETHTRRLALGGQCGEDGDNGSRIGRKSAPDGDSSSDTTFAFAALSGQVAWTEVWPRPHWVPVSPDLAIGHEEFDARYMVAGDDPERALARPVIECFLEAPEETFSWVSIWGDHVCAHGVHGPAGHADDDRLVKFVVSVTRAMHHAQ